MPANPARPGQPHLPNPLHTTGLPAMPLYAAAQSLAFPARTFPSSSSSSILPFLPFRLIGSRNPFMPDSVCIWHKIPHRQGKADSERLFYCTEHDYSKQKPYNISIDYAIIYKFLFQIYNPTFIYTKKFTKYIISCAFCPSKLTGAGE